MGTHDKAGAACNEHPALPGCCTDEESKAQKGRDLPQVPQQDGDEEPSSCGQWRRVSLPPPAPSAPPRFSLCLSVALCTCSVCCPECTPCISLTGQSPAWGPRGASPPPRAARPGGRVGPAAAAAAVVLRCQHQGCEHSSCETWLWASARNDSRGVGRQEAWVSPCVSSLGVRQKCLGVWTGRPGPDFPFPLGRGPRGEGMEAQTPESGVKTTGQTSTLVSAPVNRW